MISFAVRLAEDRDIEPMAGIAASNPTAVEWTTVQFREMLQPRIEGASLCRAVLVAEQAGEVAGFAVATALCNVFPVEAELESLAVEPALQGQGIGRALLEAALEWASGQQAGSLRLEARASNERALHIYQMAGFHPTGRRPGYYAAPVEDAVLMELSLSAAHDDVPASSGSAQTLA